MREGQACIRAFVGFGVEQDTKEKLISRLSSVANSISQNSVRWVLEKNWHVTLLFLGEIPEESLKDWASEMTNGLTDFSPFQVEVKEIALFPTPAKAGYIVATVEASPKLLAVKAAIDQVAGRLNVEVETRPFRPHITLARGKRQQPLSSTILPLEAGFSFWVNRITLYESQLMKSGAVYQSRIEQRLTINC